MHLRTVAAVSKPLHYTYYQLSKTAASSPVEAADKLNTIVTSHNLLTGFVTIFIVVYDAATGQIAYCSCGHEPALLRRAEGEVEALQTSGPPIGISDAPDYHLEITYLSPGDSLLLYTDGLSEAGPSRLELLGTGGMIRMFESGNSNIGEVQTAAEGLIAEVNAYANGIFRDDVAVLLVRRNIT